MYGLLGIRRVEHARSVFAVVLSGSWRSCASERVRREWPRRHVAPQPPRRRRPLGAPRAPRRKRRVAPHAYSEVIVVHSGTAHYGQDSRIKREVEPEAGDVIDLGAPRVLRRAAPERLKPVCPSRSRRPYTPNPRLYPGPRPKPKSLPKRAEARGNDGRGRRHKRVFRRPVPNARLYRPAPARPPPPPACPRATWPPPAPPARLETASRVALHLSEQRRRAYALLQHTPSRVPRSPGRAPRRSPARAARVPRPPPPPPPPPPAQAERAPASPEQLSRRLVVTLPVAEPAPRYRPTSEHFRLRSLDTDSGASTPAARRAAGRGQLPATAPSMDAGNRHSTSPEDGSDGNETLSAPSEFLAEFLSAIMRRQYAEALKYCRLILQYEPHNATARGFYPLLQHKVQGHKRAEEGAWALGSSSEEASAQGDKPQHEPLLTQEMMEQDADGSEGSVPGGASRSSSRSRGSCASQSSLELDSSDALAHSSPSLSLSRRTDHTDSVSAGCWESTGSGSRSEPDDNGNAQPARAADLQNDNAAASAEPPRTAHQSDSSASLRRLRAQFTCSIK